MQVGALGLYGGNVNSGIKHVEKKVDTLENIDRQREIPQIEKIMCACGITFLMIASLAIFSIFLVIQK